MLWKRRKPDEAPTSLNAPTISEADKALDTVAHLLRIYGQFAFDTDEFEAGQLRAASDQWASRIAVGTPAGDADEEAGPLSVSRDWNGVRHFMRQHREIEGAYVGRSMGNLRQAIQSFAQCLSSALHEDNAADAVVETSVSRLTEALAKKDTEHVRETAAHLVATVRDAIQKRRVREAQQLELLSERLSLLKGELTQAKADAQTDALTKLSNRAAFDEHVARLSDLGLLFSHPPCLLLLDLDHFKAINDEFGHPAGDAVLIEVGKCLTRTFLRKQDFVARHGGEEFAALIVDTPLEQAKMLADRAGNALREHPVVHQGRSIEVTLSAGVAALMPGEGMESWIRRADQALYAAKAAGRDRSVVAGDAPDASAAHALPAKGRTGSSGTQRAVGR